MTKVAQLLGVTTPETVRTWVRRHLLNDTLDDPRFSSNLMLL